MAFKLLCPKCRTADYSIERDRRIRTLADPSAGLIFSCRCGKQMFGASVVEEYERQKKAHEATVVRKVKEPARTDANAPAPVATQSGSQTESSEWGNDHQAHQLDEVGEICNWEPCHKIARPGSKYCSRACSNKNARSRYKQRKHTNEREAA